MSDRTRKRTWRHAVGTELVPGRHVVERLGGGGRTEVYRCTDDATGAHVAVKVLRPGRTDADSIRMLDRERGVLAALDHPGFPRLLDADMTADPAWLVMTQVDGPHLSGLVRSHGPVDLDQAVPLAHDVASALEHLHGRGYVHLDVKASNIVMGVRPVLLDLGAAHDLAAAGALTGGVGTITYLSPEQTDPRRFGPVQPASDLWGLGVCLLRALTGTTPLEVRRTEPDRDVAELAAACRSAARTLPGLLAELVPSLLATDPADRPTSVEVMHATAAGLPAGGGVLRRLGSLFRGPDPAA